MEPIDAAAELRPSEIKAALRFWWRAANYENRNMSVHMRDGMPARG